jgi:hypothetical protein
MASPIPVPPPVTMATVPSRCRFIRGLLDVFARRRTDR